MARSGFWAEHRREADALEWEPVVVRMRQLVRISAVSAVRFLELEKASGKNVPVETNQFCNRLSSES